ncbi:MAG: NAD-binding protein [Spirochaetales bacterium]|nr:NAD-binding protein [Spirochaetales bacterium]
MKVVILGAGRRGIRLAKRLVQENKDVIIIDEDIDDVNMAMASVDCLACLGSGTSLEDLSDAGIDDADAFVALTGSDETNLVSSGIAASEFQVPLTIASIRNLS